MNISMNSMIANTLFGSKSSISAGSFLSASNFGDLSLMRSGVYTKMLKSYYAKQTSSTDKTSSSGKNSSSEDYLNTINDKISKLKTSTSDIKNFLSGASGYASRLSTKANGFYQLASNQLTLNSGTSLYNKYGLLG